MPDGGSTRERVERTVTAWLERGAKELRDVIGRGVREIAGHARQAAARPSTDTGMAGQRDLEVAAADPAAFFSDERRRAAEELGHANILVTGQTGVGKSTLINAIFRVALADEGIGRPVTKRVQRHDVPGVPVTIFDTPGIELGVAKDDVIRDFKKTIVASRKRSPDALIHAAWYCVDAGQTRIQSYDVEIVRALADEVPVILVLTQCIDDDRAAALERAIAAEELPLEGAPVRTLARARTLAGETLGPSGLEELVRRTSEILPEAVRRAFANAQGVVVGLKVAHARAIVAASSLAATGVGAVPIPISDSVVLMPVQLGMLAGVAAAFGIDMSAQKATNLIRGLVGQGGVSAVGRHMAGRLLRLAPGVAFINAAVAGALTAALGEASIQLCSEMLRREAAGRPMPDTEMLAFLLGAYEKAFKALPRPRRAKPASATAAARREVKRP